MNTATPIFALVDCNNFYASCERLFNPKLMNKPIIVLSSNDGCVIARSNEAKQLGIKMGEPFFQIEKLCHQKKVAVFSSNFALYGDISHRVMHTLMQHCPDMEIYSVDEAFLRLDKIGFSDAFSYAQQLRQIILKEIGIPVSIGIASTKTLAKVASHLAKKNHAIAKNNVCDLRDPILAKNCLLDFPVESVWGVGRRSAAILQDFNIHTASQLCQQNQGFLKKRFSVMMTRVVLELQGTSCLTLEEMTHKKNIVCSRSFGKTITTLSGLSEAVSVYAARACEKARKEKTKAVALSIFIRSSLYREKGVFYSNSASMQLLQPSNDTIYITQMANALLKKIYRVNVDYRKAGVMLCEMVPDDCTQLDLLCAASADNDDLMRVLDKINKRYGSRSLFLAAEGTNQQWMTKSIRKSPRYTTSWDELPLVKISNRSFKVAI